MTTTIKHSTPLLAQKYHEDGSKIPVHMYEIETIDHPGLKMCLHNMHVSYMCGHSFTENTSNGEQLILTDLFNVNRIMRNTTMKLDESRYCSRRFCDRTLVRRILISRRPLSNAEVGLTPDEVYTDHTAAIRGYAALVNN